MDHGTDVRGDVEVDRESRVSWTKIHGAAIVHDPPTPFRLGNIRELKEDSHALFAEDFGDRRACGCST
jgi:hypothetical protein